ncbi:MAG: hypothetical protein WCZ90_06505 [Melioribacteraceae bacterium]
MTITKNNSEFVFIDTSFTRYVNDKEDFEGNNKLLIVINHESKYQ